MPQDLLRFRDAVTPDKKAAIRKRILLNLERYGIHWDEQSQRVICDDFRKTQAQLARHTNPIAEQHKPFVKKFIASNSEVDILKVKPYLVPVESRKKAHYHLWAYAASFWSIPVTAGFGRRLRYFVFDAHNDKLIGIVGLSDPVIGLGIRDQKSIGWSKEQKLRRLYNCMTAYILGAIPPYNAILGAKLVALTLLFPSVREYFREKYEDSALKKGKKPYLVYVDTLGAFGKSSIYTRLQGWEFVGYTKGQSHLHITANGSWELIREVVPEEVFRKYEFGDGPNWKLRILKRGLREIGLSLEVLSVGWKRGYYRLPLAENWKEYLLGETDEILWKETSEEEIVSYWKSRWILPRLERLTEKLHMVKGG